MCAGCRPCITKKVLSNIGSPDNLGGLDSLKAEVHNSPLDCQAGAVGAGATLPARSALRPCCARFFQVHCSFGSATCPSLVCDVLPVWVRMQDREIVEDTFEDIAPAQKASKEGEGGQEEEAVSSAGQLNLARAGWLAGQSGTTAGVVRPGSGGWERNCASG